MGFILRHANLISAALVVIAIFTPEIVAWEYKLERAIFRAAPERGDSK